MCYSGIGELTYGAAGDPSTGQRANAGGFSSYPLSQGPHETKSTLLLGS